MDASMLLNKAFHQVSAAKLPCRTTTTIRYGAICLEERHVAWPLVHAKHCTRKQDTLRAILCHPTSALWFSEPSFMPKIWIAGAASCLTFLSYCMQPSTFCFAKQDVSIVCTAKT
eukprot:2814936-Amphidinium_carterae.1